MSGLIGGTSHHSGVADLGETFDPTSHMVKGLGAPKWMNPHTYLKPIATKSNELISPVTKTINKFDKSINPFHNYLDKNVPMVRAINETVENRPVDAAAIAAGLFFSGGALAGAMGGGAAAGGSALAAAPAASTAGGLGGLSTAGAAVAAAITPTFASMAPAVGASTAGTSLGAIGGGGLLTASGTGTLGAAGTAFGSQMLTPSLASLGTSAAAASPWYKDPDKIQRAVKLGNNINDQFNGNNSQRVPVQTPSIPRFTASPSSGPSQFNTPQANDQLLKAYSAVLQQKLQEYIDKQKNGAW
ncbi:hypothetical protein [Methylobacter sp. YRD-M1]|uniref:hypothetical protein n=1 Tax=Methylobacter sp. YRD-M1 TaxID=2911520 RepID=UPI00227C8F6C|nr:hypothetical protein [Methylobacter sp. YRD-M1]WAK01875.1 hypothetical protein LZ558_18980 [Methylobacter sp. YRD-M1]